MEWLTNTVALVTGAGSGIGRAVALRFVEEGARVVAFDVSAERLEALRDEAGPDIVPFRGDVRDYRENVQAVECAVSNFGKLDVAVCNAGVWDGRHRMTDLTGTELAAGFDELFAINVKGYLLGAKAAAPELSRSKGCIIFTLSTSSFYVGGGGPLYVSAKHATLGLMRALAHELAPDVRVNGVAPGGTLTAMTDASSLGSPPRSGDGASRGPGKRKSNLLGVAIEPEDHAAAYVLLASAQARAMTGTVICSDGGRGVMGAQVDV